LWFLQKDSGKIPVEEGPVKIITIILHPIYSLQILKPETGT